MKIALISDTHDHMENIKEFVKIFNDNGVDYLFHCGDFVSPFVARVMNDLNENVKFFGVRGNNDGDIIQFGTCAVTIIHTPGHTPGGVCMRIGKTLISGDTIFPGGPGNTEIPGANRNQILKSIKEKLFILPGDTIIYPGHGLESTIEKERNSSYYDR